LDLLFDSRVAIHSGRGVIMLGLAYSAVEEIMVASHLAERAFVSPAYSHIRAVHEIIDKLNLFHKQPQWMDVWASGDQKQIRREPRPSKVREKLGNPPVDPIYAQFSAFGPHATFESIQMRTAKQVAPDDSERSSVRISFGGANPPHHIVWVNTFSVYITLSLLLTIGDVFSQVLHEDDVRTKVETAAQAYRKLQMEYFIPFARRMGIDITELTDLLQQEPWNNQSR
jgi:hypothetical protein